VKNGTKPEKRGRGSAPGQDSLSLKHVTYRRSTKALGLETFSEAFASNGLSGIGGGKREAEETKKRSSFWKRGLEAPIGPSCDIGVSESTPEE